jgi:hypothetical protein
VAGAVLVVKKRRVDRLYKEAESYVISYAWRCVGNNRFVVTPETLQNAFREYDMNEIRKVWVRLVDNHVIEQDPLDGEWCVRRRCAL